MTDLRKAARGCECDVRLPGVCNGNAETVVLAHLRRGNIAGVGQKPVDICGINACSACHDVIDGRTPYADPALDTYLLEALLKRLDRLTKEGTLRW